MHKRQHVLRKLLVGKSVLSYSVTVTTMVILNIFSLSSLAKASGALAQPFSEHLPLQAESCVHFRSVQHFLSNSATRFFLIRGLDDHGKESPSHQLSSDD